MQRKRQGCRVHNWFDEDNNLGRPKRDDRRCCRRQQHEPSATVRRCRTDARQAYGRGGINAAIDDADSALRFLFRVGILTAESGLVMDIAAARLGAWITREPHYPEPVQPGACTVALSCRTKPTT